MTARAEQPCKVCKGRGYVLWVFPSKKPRPAYWFNKGPNGETPSPCECLEDEE